MEMRSSSDDSQLIMFSKRLRLPLKPERLIGSPARIADHDEAPGFAGLGAGVSARDGQREWTVFVLGGVDANLR